MNQDEWNDMTAVGAMVAFTALAVARGANPREAGHMFNLAAEENLESPLDPVSACGQIDGLLEQVREE